MIVSQCESGISHFQPGEGSRRGILCDYQLQIFVWTFVSSSNVDDDNDHDDYVELELNIKFPTCWDGERVESTDQSHVAYALECGKHHNECFDFDCPDTHPVR